MRKVLLATVAVVAVSISGLAHAERKRDILGFHPGMSYQEARSAMAKICEGEIESGKSLFLPPSFSVRCSLGSRQVLESPYPAPPKLIMAPESLELAFAINIPDPPLIEVKYSRRARLFPIWSSQSLRSSGPPATSLCAAMKGCTVRPITQLLISSTQRSR